MGLEDNVGLAGKPKAGGVGMGENGDDVGIWGGGVIGGRGCVGWSGGRGVRGSRLRGRVLGAHFGRAERE